MTLNPLPTHMRTALYGGPYRTQSSFNRIGAARLRLHDRPPLLAAVFERRHPTILPGHPQQLLALLIGEAQGFERAY